MGQHSPNRRPLLLRILLGTIAGLLVSCDRAPTAPPPQASPAANAAATAPAPAGNVAERNTIACVVPAATDMLLAMGLEARLVGVSNFEPADSPLLHVDRVGDYHKLDWERLYRIRPSLLVIPTPKRDVEPAIQQRARAIDMALLDIHIDRLDDIYRAIEKLGHAINETARAESVIARMRRHLDALAEQTRPHKRPRTLIVLDEQAQFAVGSVNFIDDLLTIAGGENVAAAEPRDYPKIDTERLLQLNPEVIVQLLPGAPPQRVDAAKRFWTRLPQLQAVQNGRVYIHTEPFLLLPGTRVTVLADLMAQDLHGIDPVTPVPANPD